jgi:hypothetical protein
VAQRPAEAGVNDAMPTPGDDRWVVRPKTPRSVRRRPSPSTVKAHHILQPMAGAGGVPRPSPWIEDNRPSKRWLAFGLVGMVYVVGLVGLWSMIETFREASPQQITPAGGDETMPPLDESIDVRDARLNGPPIPDFKPQVSL